jgi:hypothetical protein
MPASTAPSIARGWLAIECSPVATSASVPKPRTTSEKLVAEQGHEQAGERHCIAKDGAEQGAIELPAGEAPDKQEDAAARRRLDRVELADRDTAEQQHDDDRRDRRLGPRRLGAAAATSCGSGRARARRRWRGRRRAPRGPAGSVPAGRPGY